MQTAIYPGSFDPVTLGHVDVIRRISSLFDNVVVCVVHNANKKTLFTLEERMDHLNRVTRDFPNVTVDCWDRLLVDYADRFDNPIVIRGLRAMSDFEYEFMMAHTNKKLNSRVETIFFAADEKYTYLSSSGVKEIAYFGGDYEQFLPEEILDDMRCKYEEAETE